jgi:hypothetical protein
MRYYIEGHRRIQFDYATAPCSMPYKKSVAYNKEYCLLHFFTFYGRM